MNRQTSSLCGIAGILGIHLLRLKQILPIYSRFVCSYCGGNDCDLNSTDIMPLRMAYRINSLTEWSLSLRMMLLRCVSAVLALTPRRVEISLVLFPSATKRT